MHERFQLGSKRKRIVPAITPNEKSSQAVEVLSKLDQDKSTTRADKIHRLAALHSKWAYEDIEEPVEGSELLGCQHQRCKAVSLIVFGFTLYEEQVDAISCLFYEQTNLLLLAKTGFGKNIIFQLLPFMTTAPGVVLILMPLKLLQAEQSEMINQLPNGKVLVLNGENNYKHIYKQAATGGYTHIFISPEIALSKKFKKNVLDNPEFTDRLFLLAVDEVHLVDQWGKAFRPLYAEIEKVRKRIPCNVPLLGVSAILTKQAQNDVLEKAGFKPGYRLMQTSLD